MLCKVRKAAPSTRGMSASRRVAQQAASNIHCGTAMSMASGGASGSLQ
jgi:hypothetical protein